MTRGHEEGRKDPHHATLRTYRIASCTAAASPTRPLRIRRRLVVVGMDVNLRCLFLSPPSVATSIGVLTSRARSRATSASEGWGAKAAMRAMVLWTRSLAHLAAGFCDGGARFFILALCALGGGGGGVCVRVALRRLRRWRHLDLPLSACIPSMDPIHHFSDPHPTTLLTHPTPQHAAWTP